eukprot:4340118-Prymnesium_polylepis.2
MVDGQHQRPRALVRARRARPVAVEVVGVKLVDQVVARHVGRRRRGVEAAAGVEDGRVVAVGDEGRVLGGGMVVEAPRQQHARLQGERLPPECGEQPRFDAHRLDVLRVGARARAAGRPAVRHLGGQRELRDLAGRRRAEVDRLHRAVERPGRTAVGAVATPRTHARCRQGQVATISHMVRRVPEQLRLHAEPAGWQVTERPPRVSEGALIDEDRRAGLKPCCWRVDTEHLRCVLVVGALRGGRRRAGAARRRKVDADPSERGPLMRFRQCHANRSRRRGHGGQQG